MIRVIAVIGFTIMNLSVQAQCAMCRTQVVNNVSAGETSLAQGLNYGIMYLFFAPYALIGVIVYLWYKKSKSE